MRSGYTSLVTQPFHSKKMVDRQGEDGMTRKKVRTPVELQDRWLMCVILRLCGASLLQDLISNVPKYF